MDEVNFVPPLLKLPQDEQGFTISFGINEMAEAKKFVAKYGVVVIRDVLTRAEVRKTCRGIDKQFCKTYGMSMDTSKDAFLKVKFSEGIIGASMPWRDPIFFPELLQNRCSPRARGVFAALLGQREEDLLVSHDRVSLFRPTELGGRTSNLSLHIDMDPVGYCFEPDRLRAQRDALRYDSLQDFIAENNTPLPEDGVFTFQAGLALTDNKEEDGGFHVVTGMHKPAIFKRWAQTPYVRQYCRLQKWRPNMFPDSDHPMHKLTQRVTVRAGSMFIWHQCCVHGSRPNRSSNMRLAHFFRFFPRKRLSATQLIARAKLLSRARTSANQNWFRDCTVVLGLSDPKPGTSRGAKKKKKKNEISSESPNSTNVLTGQTSTPPHAPPPVSKQASFWFGEGSSTNPDIVVGSAARVLRDGHGGGGGGENGDNSSGGGGGGDGGGNQRGLTLNPRSRELAPKRSSQNFDLFFVLDFEATCENRRRLPVQEIIEFPTVVVCARTMTPVAEFQQYVRPTHAPRLSGFCTELTGITQAQVDSASPFTTVFTHYRKWLHHTLQTHLGPGDHSDRFTFVTCGDWDLNSMLPRQLRHLGTNHVPRLFRSWCNIKKEYARVYNRKARGMAPMLAQLKMTLEGRHHSGIDDCRNIARILVRMMKDGARIRQTQGAGVAAQVGQSRQVSTITSQKRRHSPKVCASSAKSSGSDPDLFGSRASQPLPSVARAAQEAAIATFGAKKGQKRTRAIVVMGGAFNPPHTGHVAAMLAAKQAAEKKQLVVVGGFMAVATDGYVMHKGRDWAIPGTHRIAMCNAASAESGWLCGTSKTYGSGHQLAVEYKRYDPNVVVVHAKGGDRWRNRRKNKKKGSKLDDIEFLVSRGVDADKHKSSLMLSAVKPDLSSTAIRQHLIEHPGELGVRSLVQRGWLSAAVAEIMIARASVLRAAVPRLFDSLRNVEGEGRDVGHTPKRAKDAPKTALSSDTSTTCIATTQQTTNEA